MLLYHFIGPTLFLELKGLKRFTEKVSSGRVTLMIFDRVFWSCEAFRVRKYFPPKLVW
jgi:hypothetical protein